MSQVRTSSIQHPSSSSANIVLAADGSVEIGAMNGFRFAGTRYFVSDGTFEKADPLGTGDIGLRAIRVRVVGGGGSGGGAAATGAGQSSVGAGGAAGGYAESFITDIAGLDASVNVERGAGGSGAAATGNTGGTSSFGTLVTANGGLGGGHAVAGTPPRTATARAGGSASGDLSVQGSASASFGFSADFSTTGGVGGSGAWSLYGGGGAGGRGGAGSSAGGYGAGGGGSHVGQNTVAQTSGAGANGIVIVDCFI